MHRTHLGKIQLRTEATGPATFMYCTYGRYVPEAICCLPKARQDAAKAFTQTRHIFCTIPLGSYVAACCRRLPAALAGAAAASVLH